MTLNMKKSAGVDMAKFQVEATNPVDTWTTMIVGAHANQTRTERTDVKEIGWEEMLVLRRVREIEGGTRITMTVALEDLVKAGDILLAVYSVSSLSCAA